MGYHIPEVLETETIFQLMFLNIDTVRCMSRLALVFFHTFELKIARKTELCDILWPGRDKNDKDAF